MLLLYMLSLFAVGENNLPYDKHQLIFFSKCMYITIKIFEMTPNLNVPAIVCPSAILIVFDAFLLTEFG